MITLKGMKIMNHFGYPYHGQSPNNSRQHERTSSYWTHPITMKNVNDFNSHYQHFDSYLERGRDFGGIPFVVNINEITLQNNMFRTALWTGNHLQLTLMSLKPGEEIGLEMHPNVDQFLRIEQGQGFVQMGKSKNQLNFRRTVFDDFAIFIPAGTWHNLTNKSNIPLRLYSIYAPPNHPFSTVHPTKAFAEIQEHDHGH